MNTHEGKIVLNGATSQANRWLPALRDGYFKVDDRSLSELLAFSVEFGRLIRFYDLDDHPDGDWSGFFAIDPTIVLACIVAIRPDRAETAFLDLERQTQEARDFERKFALLTLMFATIVRIARLANQWLAGIGPQPMTPTARLLRTQLAAAIEASLAPQLRRLVAYAEGAGERDALGRPIPLDLSGFLPIWRLANECPDASIYRGPSRNRRIDHACPAIDAIFTACLDTLANLQARATGEFATSMESADHPPQTALYIAFVKLFQTAQDTINTMSSRYTHFYYHDILREDYRPAQPDSTYLTFTLATDENVTSSSVPPQTLFPAGRDPNGLDILYAAHKSLLVTRAAIVKLRALRVISGPLIQEDSAAPDPGYVIQQILGTEITTDPKATGAWNTFGESKTGTTPMTLTAPASLGFAIASPYLLLTGGDRDIKLRLYYSAGSAERLAPLLDRVAQATRLEPEDVWLIVLQQAFTLQVSTAAGWQAIEKSYYVRPIDSSAGDPGFELKITLPAAAPPVEPCAPSQDVVAPSAANPDPAQPTLKAYLNPMPIVVGDPPDQVELYPLSLLAELDLTGWEIETDVKKLTDLRLSNTDGEIDASKPFLPFGAPVVKGSFLELWQRELFVKRLSTLQIAITWFNLPPNDDGFKGWYRNYVLGVNGTPQPDLFDNTTFRVDIGIVDPGTWQIGDDSDGPLHLFRSKSTLASIKDCDATFPAQPLCPATAFDDLPVSAKEPPDYYDRDNSAVRIQLVEPAYAFGDDLYAANVLRSVINDLPAPNGTPTPAAPARCQPLKPLWNGSRLIVQCLQACQEPQVDNFRACITNGLALCKQSLLQMALDCVLDCLMASRETLGEPRFLQVQRSFARLNRSFDATLAADIRRWIERDAADISAACLDKCAMLVASVLRIEACEIEYQKDNDEVWRKRMTACLQSTADALAKPYVDCCQTFSYPNQPWLPQAQDVGVSYSAVATSTDPDAGQFFHLTPFDGFDATMLPAASLLPAFRDSGNLYIGLDGLGPPQPLTLLFQMTASGGWTEQLPEVTWHALHDNRWKALTPEQLLSDGTNGLQNSGILSLNLPAIGRTSTLMGSGQWLSASVARDASFPLTSYITPHALLATWVDNGSIGNLDRPLPAHSITASVQNLPDIQGIDQPMPSFGGRPPETGRSFQTWMGERLRHKDRGILGWDYERLVLEDFPTIWKVQTLPARELRRGDRPGDVLIVVVPGPNSFDAMDPTAPMASADLLAQIGARLDSVISPFIRLSVSNPVYVRITVNATVQFVANDGASIDRLNADLIQYLSPWYDSAARAAKDGDYASEDEISEFIQTRPYVDALLSISFDYAPQTKHLDWYFLTSARQHHITIASPESMIADHDDEYA